MSALTRTDQPRLGHTFVTPQEVAEMIPGLAEEGDKVVVISGSPPGLVGYTNAVRVHTVGDALKGAAPIYQGGNNHHDRPRDQLG